MGIRAKSIPGRRTVPCPICRTVVLDKVFSVSCVVGVLIAETSLRARTDKDIPGVIERL